MMRQLLSILFVLFLVGSPLAHAQEAARSTSPTASHFLTWQSDTYAPPGFLGKRLPSKGSSVSLAFHTLNTSESFQNVAFTWYIDNIKIGEGMGKTRTNTTITQRPGTYTAKVFLRYPNGSSETITTPIKVVTPVVYLVEEKNVIHNGTLFTYPTDLYFRALPLSFNVSSLLELDFTWNVNNITSVGQNPEKPDRSILTMPTNLPSRTATQFGITVTSLKNTKERAIQSVSVRTP